MSDLDEELIEDTQKGMYMTFKSGREHFGIAINYVNEIIQMQPIAPIPEVEHFIRGLINLRGKIIPVIDVRLRFKQEPLEYNDRTCIIVIDVQSTVIGLIVEKIEEVVTIDDKDIEPPPKLVHVNALNKYVWGIGKTSDSVKLLLDPDKLINDDDLELMEDAAEDAQAEAEKTEE